MTAAETTVTPALPKKAPQVDLDRTRDTLVPSFTSPGVNFFGELDTLAIAIGIDAERLVGSADPVVKVHASTRRIDGAGVGGGFTGVWRDPANPGQGLLLEILGAP